MTTATFILVPGAGGDAFYWHRVVPLLRDAGHEAVAVDLPEMFLHDVPADVAERLLAEGDSRDEVKAFEDPWPLDAWPDVPTTVVAGARDRLLPLEFVRRLARERLGLGDVAVVDSGHLPALSRPAELVELLVGG